MCIDISNRQFFVAHRTVSLISGCRGGGGGGVPAPQAVRGGWGGTM